MTDNTSLTSENYNNQSPSQCTRQRLPKRSGQLSGLAVSIYVACVQPRTSKSLVCMQEREERKREREKEREREKRKEKRGREQGSRPGQREKREKENNMHVMCSVGPACVEQRLSCRQGVKEEEEKKLRPTPRGGEGEEEGGRGEKKKPDPETAAPESRKRREKELPDSHNKSIQKRAPRTNENTVNTKHGARCPKPSAKNAPKQK